MHTTCVVVVVNFIKHQNRAITVAATVTNKLLSNKAFMNIIEQCVQNGHAKKWMQLMKD